MFTVRYELGLQMKQITFVLKGLTPPDTINFKRCIWTRSIGITYIVADVCLHTTYKAQMAASWYWKRLPTIWS